jgi:hypothetical protein
MRERERERERSGKMEQMATNWMKGKQNKDA